MDSGKHLHKTELTLDTRCQLTGVHLYELTSYGRQLSNSLSAED